MNQEMNEQRRGKPRFLSSDHGSKAEAVNCERFRTHTLDRLHHISCVSGRRPEHQPLTDSADLGRRQCRLPIADDIRLSATHIVLRGVDIRVEATAGTHGLGFNRAIREDVDIVTAHLQATGDRHLRRNITPAFDHYE